MDQSENTIGVKTLTASLLQLDAPTVQLTSTFTQNPLNTPLVLSSILGTDAFGNIRSGTHDTVIPRSGVCSIDVVVPHAVQTVAGTFLHYNSVGPNFFGASTVPGSQVINIFKAGIYEFDIIPDCSCPAIGPEVPFSLFVKLRINGATQSNRTIYDSGGIAAPTRTPAIHFVHAQAPPDIPKTIEFEIQGDSLPNGTPIVINNCTILLTFTALLP